ncbi:RHS repeat-associated core domain-containing protein [Streptomyces odontomachi]|uniref:RHS repeat-associated core domain-containing protein n=1 Tax=Streptomyces odontomachi TaxID=2944940 RepID=UPI0027E25340|nr:RHS repeat-associated core domain-containing protein [Streptomyces sp. ODS25]
MATRYTYDPNGSSTATGDAASNPYRFTGREDDGTGLLYYRDRYYDPETGRFISQDPTGQAGGTNLYQYALSSPTTYTDPSGDNPLIAGCVIGGLVDGGIDWLTQRLSGRKVDWGQVGASALTGCLSGMLGEGLGALGEAKGASRVADDVCVPNSFTGDTPVLMADGTTKPIKDVQVGDEVASTDPETGESGPRTVNTVIKGTGTKRLTEITIAVYGPERSGNGKSTTLTATDGHPFWVPELHKWMQASDLKPGQWLQSSAGTWVQITAIRHRIGQATVYNLSVEGLHTYYVAAGAAVLVHNAGRSDPEVVCTIGSYAVESIPSISKSQRFPAWIRQQVDDLGYKYGCHTCGTLDPVGKRWVPDHQPISSWVPDGFPQRLYPQCLECSRKQAGWARQLAPVMKKIYESAARVGGYVN